MRTFARLVRNMLLATGLAVVALVVALWFTSYRTPVAMRWTTYWPEDDRAYRAAESNAGWLMLWEWTSTVPERRVYMGPPPTTRSTRLFVYVDGDEPRGRPDPPRRRFGLHSSDTTPGWQAPLLGHSWRAASAPHAGVLAAVALVPAFVFVRRVWRRGILAGAGSFAVDVLGGLTTLLLAGVVVGFAASRGEPIGLDYQARSVSGGVAGPAVLQRTEAQAGFAEGYVALGWYISTSNAWRWDNREASFGGGFDLKDIGLDFNRGNNVAGVRFVRGSSAQSRWIAVAIPWFVAAPALVLAASPFVILPSARARRAARRRRAGMCAACGYDLRASIGACPECGAPIADPAAGAILAGHAPDQHRRFDPVEGQDPR